MSHTVRDSDEGAIRPPADVLEQIKPYIQLSVKVHDGTVVLQSESKEKPFRAIGTPEEWIKDFRRWDTSHKGGPGLSDEVVSRESIYE